MSGWIVQLDPPAVATDRVVLDLNSGPIQIGGSAGNGVGIDWGDAEVTAYETQQGQYGNSVSDFVYPNRTITIQMILGGTGYEDQEEDARSQLQQKVSLLQREGGQILRQRNGGPAMYADIVKAQLTIPDVYGEVADVEPDVQLVLETLPDFYGDEITLDQIHCTGICDAVLTEGGQPAVIEGDYPARCRIVVTDRSGHAQYDLLYGLRSRYYDSAETAELLLPAKNLAVVSGALVTDSAAQFGTSLQASVATGSGDTLLCGVTLTDTGSSRALTHLGSYRVFARAAASVVTDLYLGLQWAPSSISPTTTQNALQPFAPDAAEAPGYDGVYALLDLGTIRIDPNPFGVSQWSGTVVASNQSTAAATVSLDYVLLLPLDDTSGQGAVNDQSGVVYANHTAEIRTEGMWSSYSGIGGSAWARVPLQYGDLPRIPPSGMEQRPTELVVKPSIGGGHRISGLTTVYNVPDGTSLIPDANLDAFTVQVSYRPAWLSRP